MLPCALAFFYLFQLVGASLTNTTVSGCPLPDMTSSNHRSVWSLLASCGLTLLICVWNAIHPAVPLPRFEWFDVVLYRFSLMFISFLAPELMIRVAFAEWYETKRITKLVHNRGLEWWTMTHSHFVLIGGLALRDESGIKEIKIDEFLLLVEKAILIVQLSWFAIQIIVRLVNHLTVTLVELDTVCMALLTFPLIVCWWQKPRCPGRPHFFYTWNFVTKHINQEMSQGRNDLEKLLVVDNPMFTTDRNNFDLVAPADIGNTYSRAYAAFLLTWLIFGALHAIAWNYDFPTNVEKIMWRVSSLILAGIPVAWIPWGAMRSVICIDRFLNSLMGFAFIAGITSRLALVALTLASLRSLPSSAYETIPWTDYIPHL